MVYHLWYGIRTVTKVFQKKIHYSEIQTFQKERTLNFRECSKFKRTKFCSSFKSYAIFPSFSKMLIHVVWLMDPVSKSWLYYKYTYQVHVIHICIILLHSAIIDQFDISFCTFNMVSDTVSSIKVFWHLWLTFVDAVIFLSHWKTQLRLAQNRH